MSKLSTRMENALNDQINAELYSSYLYLSMATYFHDINLSGFAHWMEVQSQEEYSHAMKIYKFVVERLGRVTLKAIEAPQSQWASPLAAFEAAYEHEVAVTGMINNLMDIADQEKDRATRVFLHWFIDEQVEEEASADEVVQKLKMIGDSASGLIMYDRALAQRGK